MAFGPSSYVKKMHGYQENKPPLNVTGTFLSVCIYQLNGIQKFDDNKHIVDSLNENTKFGIGNNINELCFMLFDKTLDQMYEKEELLTKGKHPPYLVTITTDNDKYTYQCEWTQWYNESLLSVLYDPSVEEEYINNKIKSMRDNDLKFIPFIIYSLSSPDIPVTATLLNDYFYLVIPERKLCEPRTFQMNLEGGMICKIISPDFSIDFKKLISKYEPFSNKVSHLILDAMQENDNLKKFLFLWQALETLVKETFKETFRNVKKFPDTKEVPVDYRKSVDELYKYDKYKERKISNVAQIFIYLSIYKWKIPHGRHYDLFDKSRKFRNDFIHEPLKYPEMADLFPFYSYNNFLIINNIIRSMLK